MGQPNVKSAMELTKALFIPRRSPIRSKQARAAIDAATSSLNEIQTHCRDLLRLADVQFWCGDPTKVSWWIIPFE